MHQFVPALSPHDATGNHTLLLREALRKAGWRSEIFAEATHDELRGESIRVERYPSYAAPGDVLIYQFATSSMVGELVGQRSEPLVIDYHNITRPELYGAWDPPAERRSAEALDQLSELAPKAALGLAHSAFNERDLLAAGCKRTTVVPVLFDTDRIAAPVDPRIAERLSRAKTRGGADWLFVGRVVPPKAQHELVEALWAYRRLYDPFARLHLVGSAPAARYLGALRAYAADLGLREAVTLPGEVSEAALGAYYATADVYVSLSRHEGFGIPLVEAMAAGVPVVARDTGAVASTLGDAGLVLDWIAPGRVAAAVHRVVSDRALRDKLTAAGRCRAEHYVRDRAEAAILAALANVAGSPDVICERAAG